MIKKFLTAIIIAFSFLFLNLSFNEINIKAEDLPSEILVNAGRGTKMNYWAIVDYGADYIGDSEVTIDIQPEAIANQDVNSIVIVESGYSLEEPLVHYKRNISPEFSSKIEYSLKNTSYGEKYLTILLLREYEFNPIDSLIVDKIIIKLDHKRTIGELTRDDIKIVKENENPGASPYKVFVTLPSEIEGKGRFEDYVFKSVKYTLEGSDSQSSLSALYQSLNNFYFTVNQNGTYTIEVEDIFGAKIQKEIVIDNLMDPKIIIELENLVTTPTRQSFFVDVKVRYLTSRVELTNDLLYLNYVFNGGSEISIKESKQIKIESNGVYTVYASSLNGSLAELTFTVENIDTEDPYVQVLAQNVVYTESVHLFNPKNDIFVYDNLSTIDKINVTLKFYTVKFIEVNGVSSPQADRELTSDLSVARGHLYSTRDIFVRYTVIDEAGNDVSKDSYIHSIDNTAPTVTIGTNRKDFYINDPYPTATEIENAYNIKVGDNSLYEGSTKTIEYILDFSRLPVDSNNRLNRLGLYNIFVRVIDEAGNYSDFVSLEAEVRKKLITIEADDNQYIVYGDKKANEIKIGYHCVTRDGNHVNCSEELLEGDSISGELYVRNATYVGTYEIYYDKISIPSDLYYLAYGSVNTFTIKPRVMKIITHNQEKYYLDADPELTWQIDTRVCDSNNADYYNKDYRCTFAPGTGDYIGGELDRYKGEAPSGIIVWDNNGTLSESEVVWYDENDNLVAREINIGTLQVYETYNGGYENYELDFDRGEFLIKPKHIEVFLKNASKIYGEADPVSYEIDSCRGEYPINGASAEYCQEELAIEITRTVAGETVKTDEHGNYIDYYKLEGVAHNKNYQVVFHHAYLTIERRDISISVKGDLDEFGNPTGRYTIYYEDELPTIEVYDSSSGEKTGLVANGDLGIQDRFSTAKAAICLPDGTPITDYVNGIGLYIILKGDIKIIDIAGYDTEYNYNITFNQGELKVEKRDIWVKIVDGLTKVYGDEDKKFIESDLDGYDEYTILEANGRFIIEIIPTNIPGEDPYIPRDNKSMKYHLKRDEGIYVGDYPIKIEKLVGCENYNVYLYDSYVYTITKRDLFIDIDDQTIIYRDTPNPFTYKEGKLIDGVLVSSLQYDDYVDGTPEVGEFRHVGVYPIGAGSITVLDPSLKDVSFNYSITISSGVLKIVQREVEISVSEGQNKKYGENDPEITFSVFYNGVKEEMPEDDYSGSLGRENGEEPGFYQINWGTFKIELNGLNDEGIKVGNYLVTNFNNNHKFEITKRDITITARDVTAIYGNDYSKDIMKDTAGDGLAYNLNLSIDGYAINDSFEGDLKIIGTVDGVGEYVISAESLRIIRHYTGEDVTEKYYNFTYQNAKLTILPRTIKITPHDGQHKIYGESDGEDGITFNYSPALLDPQDKFVGGLVRETNQINGEGVTEAVGQYKIGLGTLAIKTPSGKQNYELVLDGTVTYLINKRTLTVKADDLEIYYGDYNEDDLPLKWSIIGGSLADNDELGIHDTISGKLNLDRAYGGYGTYRILGGNLVLTNSTNYNYSFQSGVLIVNRKKLIVTPLEETLSKVYGEEDPIEFKFSTNVENVEYTGSLSREPGNNAGSYRILIGTLNFGDNYDVTLKESYFIIERRVVEVTADNKSKLYNTIDPSLTYTYIGEIMQGDNFFGSLVRDVGEDVGEYEIMQGSLSLNNNYQIIYNPGIFTIYYSDFENIYIYSLTNNQYQVKGLEEEVKLYAKFNEGADESDIGNVKWSIVKNGDIEWNFTRDLINNTISFFPEGSLGTYRVMASYGGKSAIYEVYVEQATVGAISIEYVSGKTTQTLGDESMLVYKVILPENVDSEATIQWLINGVQMQANKVKDTIYFRYTPNLGKGEFKVQARIGNAISEPLMFIVKNNAAPIITLNDKSVIYIEAKTGTKYIEAGAYVTDDLDSLNEETNKRLQESLVISGYVNEDIKGTYYIRYDAKDQHGNNAITVYRQVVVRDTTAPVITINGNKELKVLYGQIYIDEGATAVDNYDGPVEVIVNSTVIIDKVTPPGMPYTVTYTAYDESGNRGIAVRYVEIIDNVSPVISLIGKDIIYVEVYTEYEELGALVEDNADGTFVMQPTSYYYGDELVDRVDTSRLGTYYVHYDYKDTYGNIGAGKVRTVIVRDKTPPVITLNGMSPQIIRHPASNYVELGAVAKDNYDGEVPVTITGTIGNLLGSYYIYYDAVDAHGNIAETVVREVVLIDVINPVIHFFERCPQYITLEALYETYDSNCDKPGYGFWVEDDYEADLESLQKKVVVTGSVDSTKVGLYLIKYDVEDMSLNQAVTLIRYVKVVDTTAPTITLLCEGGNACGSDSSQVVEVFTDYVEYGARVYDRYDQYHNMEMTVAINHNINVNKLGEYQVIYNAKDSNGNKAETVIRTVYVKDTKPPEITLIGENPMVIERGLSYVEYGATVMDNYDGPINKYTVLNAPSGMSLGKFEVIYRAVDSSGNIGEKIRIVEVRDTIPPIVLGVEDGQYYREPVSIYMVPTLGTDEVLRGWLNGIEIQSPHYVEAEGEYDLVVRDDANNEIKIWFAIDSTPPEILGIKNGEYTNKDVVEISSNEKIKYYEYRYFNTAWKRSSEQTLSFTEEGTYRIYAVDMAGNTSSITMFVIDRTAPNYNLTGVLNKGVTDSSVRLVAEENSLIVVNSAYNIPTLYNFETDGYYQVVIRDLAGNTVNLQFVINKSKSIIVNNKTISFITQHNAIKTIVINGTTYPRNSGILLAMPKLEGGFEYVNGKLFSEEEYQLLMSGQDLKIPVSETDDTYMFVGFVVLSEELNKFGSQTVDGDDEEDESGIYAAVVFVILAAIAGGFMFFIKRRKRVEDEEVEEEIIYDDYE